MEGNGTFYVAFEDNEGKIVDVTHATIESWSANWVRANAAFDKEFQNGDNFIIFS